MITYARAKKYADQAVVTGGNPGVVENLVANEISKQVTGADAKFEDLKEIANWIVEDPTDAAKMLQEFSELKEEVYNIELTPGPQGERGETFGTAQNRSRDGRNQ